MTNVYYTIEWFDADILLAEITTYNTTHATHLLQLHSVSKKNLDPLFNVPVTLVNNARF